MTIEDDDKAAGAVAKAPRVAIGDIEEKISSCHYVPGLSSLSVIPRGLTERDADRLRIMTLCILVMRNGFVIVGKSAPASAANFNVDLGKKFAKQDALRQAWAHEGYLLCERLSLPEQG